MKVLAIGPLPPPVHGSSKNFKIITEQIGKCTEVLIIDTSPRDLIRNFSYFFRRVSTLFSNAAKILSAEFDRVYAVPDGGLGQVFSLLLLTIARLSCSTAFIQHRSFQYITKKSLSMNLIYRLFPDATHIFLCDCMKSQFESLYGLCSKTIISSNAAHIEVNAAINHTEHLQLRLGFISNLSEEKGVFDSISVFKNLQDMGVPCSLAVAGPPESQAVLAKLEALLSETCFDYFGPLYGSEKDKFFSDIDILLFPTRYSNEAQPNVVLESLSKGVPVISTEIGCIGSDIDSSCGITFDSDSFIEDATAFLSTLASDKLLLEKLKAGASCRALKLHTLAIDQFSKLIASITTQTSDE